MTQIQKINWNTFIRKNENQTKSFQDLCYHLFCRNFGKAEGIRTDYNQVGLETYPIYDEKEEKRIGFQSKFFENKLSDYSSRRQIKHSIKKAKENYKDLKKIIIYTHHSFGSENPRYKQEIEKEARKIEIEWFLDSNFKETLTQPSNLDLAQLYFDFGDELGFIKNSTNPKILTFLQSSEYLKLPFIDKEKNRVEDIKSKILSSEQKDFLIIGHPGSGKTIFMHKMLQEFGGMDQEDENAMTNILEVNNAVPMLVNLKNCAADSLENILRGRQNDSKVRGKNLGFIYLFDGLDELNEEKADNELSYIHELKQKDDTKKIIISCRSGNLNKAKAKVYFEKITEYQIADLDEKYINQYFDVKNNKNKKNKLENLRKNNQNLIKEIKDILSIKLFWDTIDELDETSTVIDLLEKKVDLLLNNPEHRKNIEGLNLLDPKNEGINSLNQDISFEFQKKFQFPFPQKDLQNLILKKFPRLDYKSVNIILNYLANLFFENTYSNNNQSQTFIFQHRRYQEFFFAQKLKSEYEKNPKILRDLKVLSNHEFFEELFLKYLRKKYEKENNLVGLIELNLIDVYLGKHSGWGADDAYYMNSSEFNPSLACQNDIVFKELLADENLQIKDKISIDIGEVEKQFAKWGKDKNDFHTTGYVKSIWESRVASLLENIVIFWKAGKRSMANELRKDLDNIISLFKENKFIEGLRENDPLRDPFWNQWENFLYFRLVIKKEVVKDIFENSIRGNYDNFSNQKWFSLEESGKEKLVKSFFRVCLEEKQKELFELIDDFDEYEFLAFLDVLKSIDYLPIFVHATLIHDKIKTFLQNYSEKLTETNFFILFYKRFFNISLSQNETEFAEAELSKLREKRKIDWHIYKIQIDYAILSYTLEKNSFEELLKTSERHQLRYYNELALYAALFNDFVELLKGQKNIETIARNYITYITLNIEGIYDLYLIGEMSFFWAYIFANSNANQQVKFNLKNRLLAEENNIVPFNFYLKLYKLDSELFNRLVNESELKHFEDGLLNWNEDFHSYVDRCFELASFFSTLNPQKAIDYISKGINEGMVRHGWRKDIIVSHYLVDALEILWRNNWVTKEKLKEYTNKVFSLTLRLLRITDRDHTRYGPYFTIRVIAKYDLQLADKLLQQLSKEEFPPWFNKSVTSILKSLVSMGSSIKEIENKMRQYRKDYDYEGKTHSDYYEQKFIVYLTITQCDLYTENEKKETFKKAYEQVEELKKQEVRNYLRDDDFRKEKLVFKKLCEKNNKKCNVSFDEEEEVKRKPKITEKAYIQEVKKAKTKQKIRGLYMKLNNYNNGILLSEYISWEILIAKTFDIYGNIKLFIDLLKQNNFPHSDFWTSNSKYFHFGLAVALNRIDTQQAALKYLFRNSGYCGFVNVMKAYEVNKDKKTCLLLFERYLKFCDFLVN